MNGSVDRKAEKSKDGMRLPQFALVGDIFFEQDTQAENVCFYRKKMFKPIEKAPKIGCMRNNHTKLYREEALALVDGILLDI